MMRSYDTAVLYGVPSPPKSKLVTQYPTLPLSTSDFTVNIELCCYQQRTLQLSTSNYWLNIRHYSYQQRTLSRQQNKMFDFAKRHVRLRKVRCWVLFVRAKSADNYGIARMTSLWQSLALVWKKMADLRSVIDMLNDLVSRINALSDVSEIGVIVVRLDFF